MRLHEPAFFSAGEDHKHARQACFAATNMSSNEMTKRGRLVRLCVWCDPSRHFRLDQPRLLRHQPRLRTEALAALLVIAVLLHF